MRLTKAVGAKPKSANGAVAVGLPHRNRSVFKQAPTNKRKVIAKPTPMLAKRKGPFPGGKRVGSWEKKQKIEKARKTQINKDGASNITHGQRGYLGR